MAGHLVTGRRFISGAVVSYTTAMVRTPQGPTARTEVITFRTTRSQRAALESRAGKLGISEYLRRLIARDAAAARPRAATAGHEPPALAVTDHEAAY